MKRGKVLRAWNYYSVIKRDWTMRIRLLAASQDFRAVEGCFFTYVINERDQRRDPSNFIGGAVKIIEDALQTAGLLSNDGWKNVAEIRTHWKVDKDKPGVTVFISDDATLTATEAFYLASLPLERKTA